MWGTVGFFVWKWAYGWIVLWWRARRLAYLQALRGEINYLLDLTEQAFREQNPEIAKDKVAAVIDATAKADPVAVEQVKRIVAFRSANEPLVPQMRCPHRWDLIAKKCLICGMTLEEFDFQRAPSPQPEHPKECSDMEFNLDA